MTTAAATPDASLYSASQALSHWCVLRVGGDDAATFLDGQFTARISDLVDTAARLLGYCQPDGRVIAVATALRLDDAFGLVVPVELADDLLRRLRLFVLRAAVDIQRTDIPVAGAAGTAVPDWADLQPGRVSRHSGCTAVSLPGEIRRLLLLGSTAQTPDTGDDLPWRAAAVAAGAAPVYAATSTRFLPQSLRLQQLGGLDFRKGCYPGQEVVARLHYRGTLTRVLARVHSVDGELSVGEALIANGQRVGTVAEAAGAHGLAVVHVKAITGDTVIRAGCGPVAVAAVDPISEASAHAAQAERDD